MSKSNQFSIKRLIITRPQGQADALLANLQSECGHQLAIKHLPLLAIAALKFNPVSITEFAGIIFTSANAVRFFLKQHSLENISAQCQLIAVGEATAAQLQGLTAHPVVYPKQMNAEGLLSLTQLQSVQDQPWLLVKGVGGRSLIQETLREKQAKVTELEVYQRLLPDLIIQQQIRQANLNSTVWLVTSGEAITHLHRILGLAQNAEHQTPIITSSQRLADLATSKGFIIVAITAGAADNQLLECVKNLCIESNIAE